MPSRCRGGVLWCVFARGQPTLDHCEHVRVLCCARYGTHRRRRKVPFALGAVLKLVPHSMRGRRKVTQPAPDLLFPVVLLVLVLVPISIPCPRLNHDPSLFLSRSSYRAYTFLWPCTVALYSISCHIDSFYLFF